MQETKQEYRYSVAPKGKRFLAFIIDIIIFGGLIFIFRQWVINLAAQTFHINLDVTETAAILQLEKFYLAVDCILGLPFAVIVYIVMPLIFKNGQTVGKKLLGLILISDKGEKLRLNNLLFRTIIGFWIFEYVTSLFFYFAPFVLSALFVIITKKSISIHDYIGKTLVVCQDKVLVEVKIPLEEPVIEEKIDSNQPGETQ